ncbi:hypothetical protein ACFYUV_20900 [Nonomuraea sp. NPDC003560]|uniref:hypothetical protein n=1 Tax=Nonomuraea sp. NPDC003560 TaxID=3364341 RepID=UPI0036B305C6
MPQTSDTDPEARARLSEAINERREQLRLTWNQVAQQAGLTKEGLRSVRTETRRMMPLTKRGIEDALAWQAGSIDLILAGQPPVEAGAATSPTSTPEPDIPSVPEPGIQRWFLTELRRRRISLADLTTSINALRVIAEHHGQTLAELLLESGLVERDELQVRDHSPTRDAIALFQSEVEGIIASPHLSARQRRQIEDRAAEGLQRIREEIGGDA